MDSRLIFSFILFISCSSAYVVDDGLRIVWPSEYYFKGEEINLKVGTVQPFEIWYSAKENKSRIDYYGGTVKTFYEEDTDEYYGAKIQVHPTTTEDMTNSMMCQREDYSGKTDLLPNVSGMSYKGKKLFHGKSMDMWRLKLSSQDMRTEMTIYTRTNNNLHLPVQMILKRFTNYNGAESTHIVTNYYNYNSTISPKDLKYEEEPACEDIEIKKKVSKLEVNLKYLQPGVEEHLDEAFDSYKQHHKRNYVEDEHEMRKRIFQKNWRRVVEHNRQNVGFKLAVNEFSDRTAEELKYLRATRPSDPDAVGTIPFPYSEEVAKAIAEGLPENYDMRFEGFISPVKHQSSCGACWAFSTCAAIEGALSRINEERNLDLSEQSLIDCAWGFNNEGCDGGNLDGAFRYVAVFGIPTDQDYGFYLQQDGFCHQDNASKIYTIRGFSKVTPYSVDALKVALYKYGPVAVAIHAGEMMLAYSSGIFYDYTCDDENVNHGVTVVGYGVRDGTPYWIVKNSWGESWGEGGYILMSAINNNCHLMNTPFYTVV